MRTSNVSRYDIRRLPELPDLHRDAVRGRRVEVRLPGVRVRRRGRGRGLRKIRHHAELVELAEGQSPTDFFDYLGTKY